MIDIEPIRRNGSTFTTRDEIREIYEEPVSYVKPPLTKHLSTINRRRNTMFNYDNFGEVSSYSINERNLRNIGNMSSNRLYPQNSQFLQQQQQLRRQCRFSIIALSKDENSNGANIKIPLNNTTDDENNFIIGHSTDPSVLLNLNLTKNTNSNKHSAVVVRKPTDLLKIGQTKFICYCYIIICFFTFILCK